MNHPIENQSIMACQEKGKKRRLPAWMKTIHTEKLRVKSQGDTEISDQPKQSKVTDERDGVVASPQRSNPGSGPVYTASDIITSTMPYLSFPGTVVYCDNFSDCACFCEELLQTVRADDTKTPVGFDMEWPVSYSKGKPDKTALIQMCFSDERCFLFHVSAIGKFPKLLGDLISERQLILVGLNIEADLWKLERDFDIRVKTIIDSGSMVDVGKLANKRLKSSERWDLDGLCKNVVQKRLNKDPNIRCGSWTDVPLSQIQRNYAAADAFAGLKLYQVLSSETFYKIRK